MLISPQPALPRLEALGFACHPFAGIDANTVDASTLEETFVMPEHYALGRSMADSAAFVGAPGTGKTALRRMLQSGHEGEVPRPLFAELVSFQLLTDRLPALTLTDYRSPLFASIAAAVADALIAQPEPFLVLSSSDRAWWWAFLDNHTPVTPIELRLDPSSPLAADYLSRGSVPRIFAPTTELAAELSELVRRLKQLQRAPLVILVDGVDDHIDSNQSDSASKIDGLVRPLIQAQRLFRTSDLVWKLFLPLCVAELVAASSLVQQNWIRLATLEWHPAGLDELLEKRLAWASQGSYSSLETISVPELVFKLPYQNADTGGTPLHRELARLALTQKHEGPVRALLRLANQLFAEGSGLLTLADWDRLVAAHQAVTTPSVVKTAHRSVATTAVQLSISDLSIRIEQDQHRTWVAAMTFRRHADGQEEELLAKDAQTDVVIDNQRLTRAEHDLPDYGEALAGMFFHSGAVRDAFLQAYYSSSASNGKLRVRLSIDERAHRLHAIRWETLHHPQKLQQPYLCLNETVLFSRRLGLRGGVPAGRRFSGALRSTVAIASPPVPNTYQLKALPVDGLLADLTPALADWHAQSMTNVTLDGIAAALDEPEPPDALILVCHGLLIDGSPYLYLHEKDGSVKNYNARTLVQYLANRGSKPVFWVLASCQSGGHSHVGGEDNLVALGPQLAVSGAGAVLAMQDNIEVSTVRQGLPKLLKELREHETIDIAVSAMRRWLSLRDEAWWKVLLYLGLNDGKLRR